MAVGRLLVRDLPQKLRVCEVPLGAQLTVRVNSAGAEQEEQGSGAGAPDCPAEGPLNHCHCAASCDHDGLEGPGLGGPVPPTPLLPQLLCPKCQPARSSSELGNVPRGRRETRTTVE